MWSPSDIKLLREQRLRESQADFAARFGVNQTTVYRWETRGLPKARLLKPWRQEIEDKLDALHREAERAA